LERTCALLSPAATIRPFFVASVSIPFLAEWLLAEVITFWSHNVWFNFLPDSVFSLIYFQIVFSRQNYVNLLYISITFPYFLNLSSNRITFCKKYMFIFFIYHMAYQLTRVLCQIIFIVILIILVIYLFIVFAICIYLAPEYTDRGSDVCSFGVVLLELISHYWLKNWWCKKGLLVKSLNI
jgi:hypothetical protein